MSDQQTKAEFEAISIVEKAEKKNDIWKITASNGFVVTCTENKVAETKARLQAMAS